jgi:predicted MFS family arabinose efflux permease
MQIKKDKIILNSFSTYQKFLIFILAFLQFTIILDFMIMAPLGAILMPALKISTSQFGVVVSAYAFSAGISGFLSASFVDMFDRKKVLMFFYTGFLVGTLCCGLAPNFYFLLIARIVTGTFAGVLGSTVLAITTDLFPYEQRGRVMGVLQTSFAASQVLGLPLGLYFSNLWGWHAPFIMIVVVSLLVGFLIAIYMKPVSDHLKIQREHSSLKRLTHTISNTHYLKAFAITGLLSLGGFMIMPFSSAFLVNNVGIGMEELPVIYMATGVLTIFTGPLIGKFSDSFGKFRVFLFGALVTMIMVIIYTNLTVMPLWGVIIINIVLFIGIFSRIIPAQAMISAIPDPSNRGSFMAVNSSLQQIAGGVGAMIAGLVVTESASGAIEHFNRVGIIVASTVIISVVMLNSLRKKIQKNIH